MDAGNLADMFSTLVAVGNDEDERSSLKTGSVLVEQMKPIGAPSCGNMPNQARLPAGAFSVASSTAPPHSPPTAKPWTKRSTTNRIGAQMPICP